MIIVIFTFSMFVVIIIGSSGGSTFFTFSMFVVIIIGSSGGSSTMVVAVLLC